MRKGTQLVQARGEKVHVYLQADRTVIHKVDNCTKHNPAAPYTKASTSSIDRQRDLGAMNT